MNLNVKIIVGVIIVILAIHLIASNSRYNKNDATAYKSFEMRRLPCGRVLQRSVSEDNGIWIKQVNLFSKNGELLDKRDQQVEHEAISKIELGIFVPRLWGKDGALGCLGA